MDILSFHKISRPIYEGGLTIDCCPRGEFLVEVRRTDGTIRRPFGDLLIKNTFLNAWKNGQLNGATNTDGSMWSNGSNASSFNSWLHLFYGGVSGSGPTSGLAVGSGSAAAAASDTALGTQIRTDSSPYAGGNSITWNQTTGDTVYIIKESFPAETGSVTYREAGIRVATGSTGNTLINGLGFSSNRLINRVVFPADVTLASGEQLILTLAITVPTLAKSTGKTITISAQNGVNISGELRVIASEASIVGGTVTSGGAINVANTDHPTLFTFGKTPVANLSTKTAFDTQGTNPAWGSTNQVNGSWATYSNNSYYRDVTFTWGSGTPATNTDFRSILMRATSTTTLGGYHLLLDAQQTKASTGVLAFSLRFSL